MPTGQKHQFGTFGGVFTPSILTILGVILFMRAGMVIGEGGIIGATLILLLAKSITFLTSLSLSAISTNTEVRGGGAYYLISRSLGPEFGGAIGIALFFAVALSVPFYILGFTEALTSFFTSLQPHFRLIGLITTTLLFVISFVGANWAIRVQYLIMAILGMSILSFMLGSLPSFDGDTFKDNLFASYSVIDRSAPLPRMYNFWIIFAIYFPAVTGINAGINMSGDLKEPARSIPKGTLLAVGIGYLIYQTQILLLGGAYDRSELITRPFEVLFDNALGGWGWIVLGGVFAATLSSAVGSYIGAPRVLQALARDPILLFLKPFAKGSHGADEPQRAIVLVGLITLVVIWSAGNGTGGAMLNSIASVITMFFLYTYGMINLAAFAEAYSRNPSFRPRFRWFHWSTGLLGSFACLAVAFAINPVAALVAVVLIALLYWLIRRNHYEVAFGDARRGFFYASLKRNLLRLENLQETPKDWRPTILVLSGNPNTRRVLVHYAQWLESDKGMLLLADILIGSLSEYATLRSARLKHLKQFCREEKVVAFPMVMVSDDLDRGIAAVMQLASIGSVRPNLVMLGWPSTPERVALFFGHCRNAAALGMCITIVHDDDRPIPKGERTIDIWWRGRKNGNLMLLLGHLLTCHFDWMGARIRLFRLIDNPAGQSDATDALEQALAQARIEAEVQVIVTQKSFREVLLQFSQHSTTVILGFEIPPSDQQLAWFDKYQELLEGMPTTLIVHAEGDQDLSA